MKMREVYLNLVVDIQLPLIAFAIPLGSSKQRGFAEIFLVLQKQSLDFLAGPRDKWSFRPFRPFMLLVVDRCT
jgi:hypothetical protein